MKDALRIIPDFDAHKAAERFSRRGWQTEFVKVSNVDLVTVTPGAALECGDGRFDFVRRRIYGARVFGGVNAVAALRTGGDAIGFYKATEILLPCGCTPGTHGALKEGPGCGMFELWRNSKLKSARFPYSIPLEKIAREVKPASWIKAEMRALGGKHFTLPGEHQEKGLRLNPYLAVTERSSSGDRFRADDYVLAAVGVTSARRDLFNAEIVEQLKPDAMKLEIIVP